MTERLFAESKENTESHKPNVPSIGGMSTRAPEERDPKNAYRTPRLLVKRIAEVLCGIELDPCTTPDNPCGAERFYTPNDDGILMPWDASRIYVNPPYGKTIRLWVRKGLDAASMGARVLMLVPSRTDARWFQEAIRLSDAALFVAGRIRFVGSHDEGENDAPFPSVFLAYNVDLSMLQDLGVILKAK